MSNQPVVLRDLHEIRRLVAERHGESFTPPDEWRDLRFSQLDPTRNYSLAEPVKIEGGKSTFWNRDTTIEIRPQQGQLSRFGVGDDVAEVRPCNVSVSKRWHNIKVGSVAVAEHALSLRPGLGLNADFELTAVSFPSFNNGLGTILDGLHGKLVDCGPARFVGVRSPVALRFANGGYMIVEPAEKPGTLTIDHQFSHKKNALGDQRVEIDVRPDTYAFLAQARTVCYRWWTTAAKIVSAMGIRQLPKFAMNAENVVFVDKQGLLNGRPAFDHQARPGVRMNREPILHEVVDKLGPLALIPDRLAARVTTFKTNHDTDVAAVKRLIDDLRD